MKYLKMSSSERSLSVECNREASYVTLIADNDFWAWTQHGSAHIFTGPIFLYPFSFKEAQHFLVKYFTVLQNFLFMWLLSINKHPKEIVDNYSGINMHILDCPSVTFLSCPSSEELGAMYILFLQWNLCGQMRVGENDRFTVTHDLHGWVGI